MKISFFKLVYLILFKPQVFYYLRNNGWWQALRPLLVLCVVSGMAIGHKDWSETEEATTEWSDWLYETQIESIEIGEDKLIYKTKKPLPYTISRKGIRFHFTEDGEDFIPNKSDLADGSNIWISPSRIEQLVPLEDEVSGKRLYHKGLLLPDYLIGAAACKLKPQKELSKVELQESIKGQLQPYFYGLCFSIVLGTVLICATLLALMQLVLRSPVFKDMSFSQVLGTYYYCAIPGLIIATVYDLLPIQFMDFSQVFVFSLFFYLLIFAGPNIRSSSQIIKDLGKEN